MGISVGVHKLGGAKNGEGGGGAKRRPISKTCHTYPTIMKLASYTLPKEDPKNI